MNLITKKIYHNKQKIKKFPKILTNLPNHFYIYININIKNLLFNQKNKFFNITLTNKHLIKNIIYPIISTTQIKTTITIIYKNKNQKLKLPKY